MVNVFVTYSSAAVKAAANHDAKVVDVAFARWSCNDVLMLTSALFVNM